MVLDLSRRPGELVPVEGWVTGLSFDGRLVYLWYGPDQDEQDCVAARPGRLYTFASPDDCRAAAQARGWAPADGDDGVVDVTDLAAAQDWLRGKRSVLEPQAGLDLWTWGADVAHSTGLAWNDRGGLRQRCHDNLFAAAMPWIDKTASHPPTWTPRQLRMLREVLNRAVHLLRTTMPD